MCVLYWGLQVFFLFYLLTITLTSIFCFTSGGFAWTLYRALYGAHSHGLHFWVCLVRNVHEIVFLHWQCLFCPTLHEETDTGPVCFSAALASSCNTKPWCSCTYAYVIVVEDYLCNLKGLLVLSHTNSSDRNKSKNSLCFYSEAELYWLLLTETNWATCVQTSSGVCITRANFHGHWGSKFSSL